MKTDIKHLAAFVATAIWADGEYDEAEKIVVEEIADAFELDAEQFAAAVEAALAEVEGMDEEQVNAYILEHSAEVEDEEAVLVYEAALQTVLVDGVLGAEEVSNLLSIASALGIDDEQAVLLLVDMVKEEPELTVEL
jgi:tellurite resistance protein